MDQLGLRQTCCRSINGTLCDESAPANQAVILSHSEPNTAREMMGIEHTLNQQK